MLARPGKVAENERELISLYKRQRLVNPGEVVTRIECKDLRAKGAMQMNEWAMPELLGGNGESLLSGPP